MEEGNGGREGEMEKDVWDGRAGWGSDLRDGEAGKREAGVSKLFVQGYVLDNPDVGPESTELITAIIH